MQNFLAYPGYHLNLAHHLHMGIGGPLGDLAHEAKVDSCAMKHTNQLSGLQWQNGQLFQACQQVAQSLASQVAACFGYVQVIVFCLFIRNILMFNVFFYFFITINLTYLYSRLGKNESITV